MSPDLQTRLAELEQSFSTLQADNIRFYYGLGQKCKEIKDDVGKYVGKDGTPGMELVEQAMAVQARTLRKCTAFVEAYDDADLRELLGLRNTVTGFQLHWGHVSYLLTLPSREERADFAHRAVSDMWDPSTLHEKIKKKMGRSGGHGRKRTLLATIEKQAKHMRDLCRNWVAAQREVWNGPEDQNVFANLLEASESQVTDDTVEYLTETRELMLDIGEAAEANIGRLDRAIAHCTDLANKRVHANTEQHSEEPRRTLAL